MRYYETYDTYNKQALFISNEKTNTQQLREIGKHRILDDNTHFQLTLEKVTPSETIAMVKFKNENQQDETAVTLISMSNLCQWITCGMDFHNHTKQQALPYTFIVQNNQFLPLELLQEKEQPKQTTNKSPYITPSKLKPLTMYQNENGDIDLIIGQAFKQYSDKKKHLLVIKHIDTTTNINLSTLDQYFRDPFGNHNIHITYTPVTEHTYTTEYINNDVYNTTYSTKTRVADMFDHYNDAILERHIEYGTRTHDVSTLLDVSFAELKKRISEDIQNRTYVSHQGMQGVFEVQRKCRNQTITVDDITDIKNLYYVYLFEWLQQTNEYLWVSKPRQLHLLDFRKTNQFVSNAVTFATRL